MIGVGQIGCSPNELAQNSPDGRTCVARINSANQMFNSKLKSLVDTLNNQFTDARFIYIDAYGIFQDLISSPSAFGNFHAISPRNLFAHLLFELMQFFTSQIKILKNSKCYVNYENSTLGGGWKMHLAGFELYLIFCAGFTVTNRGCCGVGRNNGQITCLPFQTPCPNRNQHLFWDAFHPTEAANIIVGRRSYRAQKSSDAYPIDISRLAQL